MFLTKIDSFPLIIYYFKKLHLIRNKNVHFLLYMVQIKKKFENFFERERKN